MITFPLLFKLDIIFLLGFVGLVLIVYLTKLLVLWLDSFKKELFWIKLVIYGVCDIAANMAIIMPILIILANLVFLILMLI